MKPSLMTTIRNLAQLRGAVRGCRACPRLVRHHERLREADPGGVWGPVPGMGGAGQHGEARVWVVGLAPGAKGAGYTGEPLTRDASGRFFRAALRRAGLADRQVFVSNAVRCVPPGNRPTRREVQRCRRWLELEWHLVRAPVVVCLGRLAWEAVLDVAGAGRVRFVHGARTQAGGRVVYASYHVSPLNVNTTRLTAAAFDTLLRQAVTTAEAASARRRPASG